MLTHCSEIFSLHPDFVPFFPLWRGEFLSSIGRCESRSRVEDRAVDVAGCRRFQIFVLTVKLDGVHFLSEQSYLQTQTLGSESF